MDMKERILSTIKSLPVHLPGGILYHMYKLCSSEKNYSRPDTKPPKYIVVGFASLFEIVRDGVYYGSITLLERSDVVLTFPAAVLLATSWMFGYVIASYNLKTEEL